MESKVDSPNTEELKELLDSLYREHAAFLVELAQVYGCSPDYAEDIVQETFRIAVDKAEAVFLSPNRKGWLIQTMKHRIGHNYRAMQYAQRLQRQLQDLYSGEREDQIKLKTLYAGLVSEEDLSLLIHFYVDSWSVKALAASLHIKEETCKKRIQRAKARFLKAYKEYVEHLK